MNTEASQEEQALHVQLAQARDRVDGLVRDVQSLDKQLEGLSAERQQVELLEEVCNGLEKLSAMNAADLFWDGLPGDVNAEAHVHIVRSRIAELGYRVEEVENTRRGLLQELQHAEDEADLIAEDVLEAQRQAEMRKLEWVIEREASTPPSREAVMPWSRGSEDDQRFRKSLALSLLLSLLLGALLPLIDIPVPDRWETVEIPERLASLIKEEPPPPPPEPEVVTPQETVPEASDEAQEIVEEIAPKATPEPAPKANVESKGILAFRDKFSGLHENDPIAKLGTQARIDRSGELASGRPQRSMVASTAPGSSGGINVAALSRDSVGGGGQDLEGVAVQRATSSIGAGGASDRPLSGGPGLGRTDEEIQIVFDRHKSALYRLYNRELRRNPTLQGQIVLRMTIEPDGSVSLCEVKSTDMKAPKLAAQVVGRVKTFDFGAKEGVPPVTILYPIDFLPAT